MGKSQYSRVYRYGHKRFRYNYADHVLEWIDKDNTVIDSIGLSVANWKDAPKNWVEQYSYELDEELRYLMDD